MPPLSQRGYRANPPDGFVKAPLGFRAEEKRAKLTGLVWIFCPDDEDDASTAEGEWKKALFTAYVTATKKFTTKWPTEPALVTKFGPANTEFDWGDYAFPPSTFAQETRAPRSSSSGVREAVAAAGTLSGRDDDGSDYDEAGAPQRRPPAATTSEQGPPWGESDDDNQSIHFGAVMKLLKKTTADTWGTNGRALWATYKESAWADLSLDQKNKVLTFWHKLPQDTKNTVIQAGIAFAAQAAKAPATHKKDRALNTTGDDMARLLHILFDPSLLSIKSKILKGTKTREELENKDDDPYGELARPSTITSRTCT